MGAAAQWTLLILAIPSFAIAVAQWLAFRYRLVGDELIIDSGVLSRRRRVIPVARIQNVDMKQSALERLAGVAELRIETASGGSETEASLAVLAADTARAFRGDLLQTRGHAASVSGVATREDATSVGPSTVTAPMDGGVVSEQEEELLRLSMADLAIAGATSNEAGLIAAGLATGLQLLDDLGALARVDTWLGSLIDRGAALGATGAVVAVLGLVLGFVILGWLVSIAATVIRFYGFTLTRVGDDLRREYGLLSRHNTTVPLRRVQSVRIEETLLRRPLGLAALKIETAGAGPKQRENAQGGGAEAYVPITRRKDVGRLIRAVFEDARFEGVRMNPVAPVSRRRSFVRLAVPVALGAVIAGWVEPTALALVVLLVPAWFIAVAQYRARAWGRTEGYVIIRSGVLTRTNAVIPERKIQTLHTWETPFQRRWSLATLMVDTAGGGRAARAVDLRYETARSLLLDLARDAESRASPTRQG